MKIKDMNYTTVDQVLALRERAIVLDEYVDSMAELLGYIGYKLNVHAGDVPTIIAEIDKLAELRDQTKDVNHSKP